MASVGYVYKGKNNVDLAKAVRELMVSNLTFRQMLANQIATREVTGNVNKYFFSPLPPYHNAGGNVQVGMCTDMVSCIAQAASGVMQGIGQIAQAVSAPQVAKQQTQQASIMANSANYVADDNVTIALYGLASTSVAAKAAGAQAGSGASMASGIGGGGSSNTMIIVVVLLLLAVGGFYVMSRPTSKAVMFGKPNG